MDAAHIRRLRRSALLTVAVVLIAGGAEAALSPGKCLAQKRKAWGDRRKCEATEEAKALQGKTADLGKCASKLAEKLAKIDAKASKAVIACRYADRDDGTVIDYDTGLQWEQKTPDPPFPAALPCFLSDEHCVTATYVWSDAARFVELLNGTSYGGTPLNDVFAEHSDWRLPSLNELQTIRDTTAPGCSSGGACIDAVFGPTIPGSYWSATPTWLDDDSGWHVGFGVDSGAFGSRIFPFSVRAVRRAL